MKKLLYFFFCISFLGTSFLANSQTSKRILFIGNSYTGVNNLPKLIFDIAQANNKTITYDSHTPGGASFENHASNASLLAKIKQGNWDKVVLQDQSQRPSFPDFQVATDVYPYAKALVDSIKKYNPCAQVVFYITWGRENGDQSNCSNFPPLCTYEGMDSLLTLRYKIMATSNDAELAPVGPVWRNIRTNFPTTKLYATDGSHPNFLGSYLAALTFYTTFFKENPISLIKPTSANSVTTQDDSRIKAAIKTVLIDSILSVWKIGKYDTPIADFTFQSSSTDKASVQFTNTSKYAKTYSWTFGDGNVSNVKHPFHKYLNVAIKNYSVRLISDNSCGKRDTIKKTVNIVLGVSEFLAAKNTKVYPNPVKNKITIDVSKRESRVLSLNLYDLLGKRLKIEPVNKEGNSFTFNYPTGIYFLEVIYPDISVYKKIIKKNE